jgi:hypothetical protein
LVKDLLSTPEKLYAESTPMAIMMGATCAYQAMALPIKKVTLNQMQVVNKWADVPIASEV